MQVRRVPIDSVAAALRDFWRQVFMTSETEMTLIVGHPRLLSAKRSQWEEKRTRNTHIEYFQNRTLMAIWRVRVIQRTSLSAFANKRTL